MSSLPQEKLEKLVQRWEEIQAELSQGADPASYARLTKEFAEIGPVVEAIRGIETLRREVADLEEMARDSSAGREMAALAAAELESKRPLIGEREQELRVLLLPKDAADDRSCIVEIRAGTGGDEAALFAADLYRMYQRYADLHGWTCDIISISENDLGGYKEIIASISGRRAFAKLKFESGVHRVQRVPATESQGRIHTSAATVAVLPEAQDVDIDVRAEDIRIDTMRASGAGGQHVNKTDSAVRITHLPTGLIVVSAQKSQHQNRRLAMQVLRSRLYELEREKVDSARSEARRSQVGSGDRSQRIRTYNFPQGRVTDHRINLTLHNLDRVMDGTGLDEIVAALSTEHQAEQLAALEGNV